MAADIDPDLGPRFNRTGMNASRLRPSALGLEAVGIKRVDQPLGDLRAGRIVNADEEDVFFQWPSTRGWVLQTRPRIFSRMQDLSFLASSEASPESPICSWSSPANRASRSVRASSETR